MATIKRLIIRYNPDCVSSYFMALLSTFIPQDIWIAQTRFDSRYSFVFSTAQVHIYIKMGKWVFIAFVAIVLSWCCSFKDFNDDADDGDE